MSKKVISKYGTIRWYNERDQLHRKGGPAVEYSSGYKAWYLNGKRHREDGPAIEYANGDKEWYLNGKRHREGGPAVEYADGNKVWYLNGMKYSELEYKVRLKGLKCDRKLKRQNNV